MKTKDQMSFKNALKKLNIEDFGERIFHSNSHGELVHLQDYIEMASIIKDDAKWFRPMFLLCVRFAEENWKRPESCFQHMPRMLQDFSEVILIEKNKGTFTTQTQPC